MSEETGQEPEQAALPDEQPDEQVEAPDQEPEEASEEVSEEAPEAASEEALDEQPDEASEEALDEEPAEASEEAPAETPDEASEEASAEAPDEEPVEVADEEPAAEQSEPDSTDDDAPEPEASEDESSEAQQADADAGTHDLLPKALEQYPEFDEDQTEQLPPRRLPSADSTPPIDPADPADPADQPPRLSRRQLFLLSGLSFAVILGMVWGFLLHRYDTGDPHQITGSQLQGLQLDGVWDGPGGARITLTGTAGNGTFTFTGMSPLMFVISDGDWPSSDNGGTWSLGQMQHSQWSESGLVFEGDGSGQGSAPQLMLLPIGSASSPELACYLPLAAGVCVFKRE